MNTKIDWVKIKYTESGGVTGLFLGCERDSREMDKADGDKLCQLVEQSEILDVSEPPHDKTYAGVSYTFEVTTDSKAKIVKFNTTTLPEKIYGLRDYLCGQSRFSPPNV